MVYVLFVIEDDERNVIDQKLIESELYSCCKIRSLRCTFEEIYRYGRLDNETGVLRVHNREIAFVYYRTGYQLDQYKMADGSDIKWLAREILECSLALKCPSVDVQLTTFKKYQQAFGDE